jgi:hypothetical protein
MLHRFSAGLCRRADGDTYPAGECNPGQTFNVSIGFSASSDDTYGLGLRDVVPSGWTIAATEADSTPDADVSDGE